MVSVSNQTKKIYISSSGFPYISLPDQPSPSALYSGIILFNHELPPGAVISIPPVTSQDAITVVENNATSTLTATSDDGGPVVISGGGRSSSRSSGGGGSSSSGGIVDELPTVSTENATNVSVTTATLNMGFDFNDYDTVHLQFKYKAKGASAWDDTDLVLQSGLGAHRYTEQIANLSANTTYCFMAILRYDSTELNGTELNFTTSRERIPPIVETENATSVSASTATLNMGFEFHDYAPVNVQFRYKDKGASAWYDTGWVAQNGSGADTYAEPIANLSANTTYCFMAMLLYDSMAVNGYEFNFTTCRELIPPTVWTGNATNVSTTTATLNMGFEFNDYAPVNVQFRYKVEGANVWYDTGWEARNGSGADTYAEQIADLSANTTYYFMALLLYNGMAVNGTVHTFTTCRELIPPTVWTGNATFTTRRELIPPTVWTGNATNVSVATATGNMGFEFHDYAPVNVQHRYNVEGATKATNYSMATTEKATCVSAANVTLDMVFEFQDYSSVQVQFRYKAEGATEWTDTDWVQQNGSGADTYAEQIANLSPNTTYYYMALLLYDGMAVNGTVHTFTTCRERIPATVWTGNATNVSMATATLNMGFEFHDYAPVNVQFRYKAEGAIGWTDTGWVQQNGSGADTYAEQIADLSANTTYYYMAQLLYDSTELEGVEKTFTTLEPPPVRTGNATNITDVSARLNMTCDLNDYDTVQVQFKYKAEGANVWAETGWVYQNESQTYSESIANLSAITTYYYKAQLLYDSTEIEGVEKSFMTLEPPAVHTKTATNVTDATATLNMAFDFNDYNSVQVQFRYKAKDASEWNDTGWVAQNGSGYHWYSEPIAGLSSSTVYQFKAQLRYDGTVIEGTTRSFMTMEKPKVSTKNAIAQKLPRGWAVTLKMDYDFKDYDHGHVRFAYKKVGDADWDHTDWIGASHSGTYDELIMGLDDHTTYYFYAQLKYGDENNINGDTLTFKTLGPR
jgi:hypothetical protein